MEPSSSSKSLIHQSTYRSASAPFSGEIMSNSVSASTTTTTDLTACSTAPAISQPNHHHAHHQHDQRIQMDSDAGNQSDSSGNSNSSLASSTKYNERKSRLLRQTREPNLVTPLNENCLLDATESQLALNLRRATRSTSWTNQKILDAIDGLNTCEKELDPCLALEWLLALVVVAVMLGRIHRGPPLKSQKGENSCYNFLCGITEDEDEEQDDCNNKHSSSGAGASFRLPVSPASLPVDEKRKHVVAGGETVEGDPLSADDNQVDGAHVDFPRRSRNGTAAISMKKVMIQENDLCSDRVISIRSEMDSNLCNMSFDKQHNNAHNSLYGTGNKKERPSAYQNLHNVRFEDDDEVPTQ
ncbi:hypothetical protein Ocin01_20134 [Orchesella cincta]|uniref:Uncharacterized protein n=1 Tax=Orchesella cincta TaxID=48709 RepID=A0A1D2M0Q7_ORCCI|nr:hypothetical protein Ocin01_20134 [Orchesella cincta]